MKITKTTLCKLLVLFAIITLVSAILLFASCSIESSVPVNRDKPAITKPCLSGAKSFVKELRTH